LIPGGRRRDRRHGVDSAAGSGVPSRPVIWPCKAASRLNRASHERQMDAEKRIAPPLNSQAPIKSRANYDAYMRSDAWRAKRTWFLRQQPTPLRCYCCNRRDNEWRRLEIHHVSYANFGAETRADLRLVCLTCHGLIHSTPDFVRLGLFAATEIVRASRQPMRSIPSFGLDHYRPIFITPRERSEAKAFLLQKRG
jgi:hypothetical protein